VQSLPRIDHAPRRAASVSADADWGNVRYGKGFRRNLSTLKPFLPSSVRCACSTSVPAAAFGLELKGLSERRILVSNPTSAS
jgi:hypothetical protein